MAAEWWQNLDWEPVNSASGWVEAAAFSPVSQTLFIRFDSGAVCAYISDEDEFADLLAAPSAGTWVHENVYDRSYSLV